MHEPADHDTTSGGEPTDNDEEHHGAGKPPANTAAAESAGRRYDVAGAAFLGLFGGLASSSNLVAAGTAANDLYVQQLAHDAAERLGTAGTTAGNGDEHGAPAGSVTAADSPTDDDTADSR